MRALSSIDVMNNIRDGETTKTSAAGGTHKGDGFLETEKPGRLLQIELLDLKVIVRQCRRTILENSCGN